MAEPPSVSAYIARAALYHVSGAMRQLRSYSAAGPTVYALTITGAAPGSVGAASVFGPAVGPGGVGDWPGGSAGRARAVFAAGPAEAARRAGGVVVLVTLQAGRVSHCVAVNLLVARARAARDAGPALSRPAEPALPRPAGGRAAG